MKFLIVSVVCLIAVVLEVHAQGDSIVVYLKNGTIEKIAISQIQKVKFIGIPSGVEDSKGVCSLAAVGNFPNPFSESTNIGFEITMPGDVTIHIYNNSGKLVRELACSGCQPGKCSVQWDCLDKNNNRVQSGPYFYEVCFGNEIFSKKMILVK